jgi:hypothetical protein
MCETREQNLDLQSTQTVGTRVKDYLSADILADGRIVKLPVYVERCKRKIKQVNLHCKRLGGLVPGTYKTESAFYWAGKYAETKAFKKAWEHMIYFQERYGVDVIGSCYCSSPVIHDEDNDTAFLKLSDGRWMLIDLTLA